MKRKFFTAFLAAFAVVLAAGTVGVFADYGICNGVYYMTENDEAVITGRADNTLTRIEIPDTIAGCPVTSVANDAFAYCGLKSVTLPDSLTSIGESAFFSSSLTQITIPKNVDFIGDNAFGCCLSIKSIDVAGENKSYSSRDGVLFDKEGNTLIRYPAGKAGSYSIPQGVKYICKDAFHYSVNLTSITVPDSVTALEQYSFAYCCLIREISLPKSVRSVGYCAFFGCDALSRITVDDANAFYCSDGGVLFNKEKTELVFYPLAKNNVSYTIPQTVTLICDYAFFNNKNITEVTLPDKLVGIGEKTFKYCEKLKNLSFPEGLTVIGLDAFAGCNALTDVTTPEGMDCISQSAFADCKNLKTLTIFDGLTTIENSAFARCTSLTEITLPKSITQINGSAFTGCKNLSAIYLNGTALDWKNVSDAWSYGLNAEKIYFWYVTLIDRNGDKISQKKYTADSLIDISDITQKPDYGIRLYTDRECTTEFDPKTPITENTILHLRYVQSKCTYKFLDDNGKILKEEKADYGSVITPPEAPADKDPYTFDRWDGYTDGMILTEDCTFTAVYKYKTYAITAEGVQTPIYAVYNSAFEISPQAPPEEYLFDGYYTEKDGQGTRLTDSAGKSLETYGFSENITAYPYFTHELLNKIKISGDTSTVVGNTRIVKNVYFATDKSAQYLLCGIKFPQSVELKEIVPKDFKYVFKDSELVSDGVVRLDLVCQYTNALNPIPVNRKIEPFELIFDIPQITKPQNVLIELTADSVLYGDEDFEFDYIINDRLEIAAKPIESIEISGADIVVCEDGDVTYSAVITPDYATNKEVLWSVDNEEIAIITQSGVLTPKATGTITVTAAAKDGSGVSDTKTIKIIAYAKLDTLKSDIGVWDAEFTPAAKEYTVYVPNDAKSFALTAGFSRGTLRLTDGTMTLPMLRNKEKSVTLTSDTTVFILNFGIDGCADSEYKITVKRFEGTVTTASPDRKTLTVTPINIESGNTVILALYDNYGLAAVYSEVYHGTPLTFMPSTRYSSAKVAVWESFGNMIPVCETEILK